MVRASRTVLAVASDRREVAVGRGERGCIAPADRRHDGAFARTSQRRRPRADKIDGPIDPFQHYVVTFRP